MSRRRASLSLQQNSRKRTNVRVQQRHYYDDPEEDDFDDEGEDDSIDESDVEDESLGSY